MGNAKNQKDEVHERLSLLMDFLIEHSAFAGDNLSWSAGCIKTYLDGKEKTLDHAFGLRSSKRGPKPMQSGVHADWVASAFWEVFELTPKGQEWPDTETLARIGRYYGLGGRDATNADSHGIASELKRILERYKEIIVKQNSDELNSRLR